MTQLNTFNNQLKMAQALMFSLQKAYVLEKEFWQCTTTTENDGYKLLTSSYWEAADWFYINEYD